MIRRISIYMAIAVFICSCRKSNQETNQPDNTGVNTILVSGKWKLISETSSQPYDFNGDGTQETDVYASMSVCNQDFKILFTQNMDGSVWQNCSLPQKNITWNLSDYGNTLNWTMSAASPVHEKIISISATTLVTSVNTQPPGTTGFIITNTYSKQ
jgi:hypothetical protein